MSKSAKKNVTTEKTVEEIYKKKELHQHILDRPDSYIGSRKSKTDKMWIYNTEGEESEAKICLKEIDYVPGFYKICDEILVNARDHFVRCITDKLTDKCTMIKITVDKTTGEISVWNNGDGVHVAMHKEHNMYVPTLIFGHLLTSANYDDDDEKIVGGRNGYGAKLTNIYSTSFEVETVDAKTNQKFTQKWTDNMFTVGKPKIKALSKPTKPYTKITFVPDFEKFKLKGITKDMFNLLKKRAYDIAMTTDAKVYFNDKIITVNNFTKYIDAYFPEGSAYEKVLDISTKRWRVCAVYDPTDKLDHQNISFVNGICTNRGGSHVDMVVNQVVEKIKERVMKQVKNLTIKPAMIKENLIFFVDVDVVNPVFDTQTKEFLTTKASDLGSKFVASEAFLKKIIKTGIVEQIVTNATAKAEANLSKTDGRKQGTVRMPKLFNAEKAGTKESHKCLLILTEGDSAMGMAMSGLNVCGRKYYGVFPLKGKLMNVREKPATDIAGNDEITAIKKIMGLVQGKKYQSEEDFRSLKYGGILILTDQDVDGSHIKGLIMNFIHFFWPELAKRTGFIRCLATPVIKMTKGKGKTKEVVPFYNLSEFEAWKNENNGGKGYTPKYYKGLGTHEGKEAQECFEDIDDKLISYTWKEKVDQQKGGKKSKKAQESEDSEDEESTESKRSPKLIDEESDMVSDKLFSSKIKDVSNDAITLAFDKKRADDRKTWINYHDPDIFIDNSEKEISYYDFIHKELIAFSYYDVCRSIPNIMDGFKPGQRKVYFGSVKKNIYNTEVKVAQLGGYISEHTHYHHGEKSLFETIIGMAQNFVGKNNLNLFVPKGNFGSRLLGGKDAASERYIFTQLDEITKKIFIADDFDVLKHQRDDGDMIEPMFYAPILPMVLVNGTHGIGTGYSTDVEQCNPRDIVENLRRIIAGEKPKAMLPWYRHFNGTVEKVEQNKYLIRAKYERIDEDTIKISDLPVGSWTIEYKTFLENLLESGVAQKVEQRKAEKQEEAEKDKKVKAGSKTSKKVLSVRGKKDPKKSKVAKVAKTNIVGSYIKSFDEDCTDVRVSFTIHFHPKKLSQLIKSGELETKLKLVTSVSLNNMHLFDENGKIRKYESYGAILNNFAKVRLQLYQARKDYLLGKYKKEIDILTWKMKFIKNVISGKMIIFENRKSKKEEEINAQLAELDFPKFAIGDEKNASYKYLTTMTILNLSTEQIDKLQKQIDAKQEEIDFIENKTPAELWSLELDDFMEAYDAWEQNAQEEFDELMRLTKKDSEKKNKKKRGASKEVEKSEE